MGETKESLLKLANASGFLLQLRVEHEVCRTSGEHGWAVAAREHRWVDAKSENEGYVDLLLHKDIVYMTLECKRVLDTSWVFLLPDPSLESTEKARILWTNQAPDRAPLSGWSEFAPTPKSPESAFCVVRGQSSGSKPMLERLCGVVLQSLEGLAQEGLHLPTFRHDETIRVYVPAIVTTARLEICRFDSKDIDIQDGKLPDAQFESVPYIRFRKGLSTSVSSEKSPRDFAEANQDQERTVFVIQASELIAFLKEWKLWYAGYAGWPWKIGH